MKRAASELEPAIQTLNRPLVLNRQVRPKSNDPNTHNVDKLSKDLDNPFINPAPIVYVCSDPDTLVCTIPKVTTGRKFPNVPNKMNIITNVPFPKFKKQSSITMDLPNNGMSDSAMKQYLRDTFTKGGSKLLISVSIGLSETDIIRQVRNTNRYNVLDDDGHSILEWACKRKYFQLAILILQEGASPILPSVEMLYCLFKIESTSQVFCKFFLIYVTCLVELYK